MRKIVFLLFAWCAVNTALAQLSGDGFYRVQNVNTERYLTFVSRQIIKSADGMDADLSQAMITKKDFDNEVVKDPGSIVYISKVSGGYGLQSQGLDSNEMLKGIPLVITASSGAYICSGTVSASGATATKTLYDQGGVANKEGFLTTSDTGNKLWYIKPVKVNSNNYFGLIPTQYDDEYWTTLKASFAFEYNSKNMEVYYVKNVYKQGVAVIAKVNGTVPAGAPVIIKCSSPQSLNNKLNLIHAAESSIAGNLLLGAYLGRTIGYNPATMRLLGKGSDGRKAFITVRNRGYINPNEAYLVVPNGYPEELQIMTEEEWNEDKAITVTIDDAVREYGASNPKFTCTISPAGAAKGIPELYCDANEGTPVGSEGSEYEIKLRSSSLANSQVTVINGRLTIKKAPLRVVPMDKQRMLGQPNPEFDAYYISFRNGENESVLTKKPVFSCPTLQEKVGKYPIIASGGEAANYELLYEEGTLEILPPSVRPLDAEREYGDENPAFKYTPEGILNSEPIFSCSADKTSEVGTYTISMKAGSPADNNIDFSETATLTVRQAPLYVSFSQSIYRINEGEPLPDYQLKYEGFKNGEDESVLTEPIKVVYSDQNPTARGRHVVKLSGGAAKNYSIVKSDQVVYLYVDEAKPVTVTATNYEREYGDPNPEFTYTVQGATLNGEPSITCEADATSAPGQYPIKISKGGVTNAKDTYVDGVLTILPAPLTIAAGNDFTRKQGEENPDFTEGLTYSGFKNGETADVLTVKPTVTCAADKDSEPGEYDVVVSGAESPNYTISYVNGKLTVGQADELIVVAKNYTRKYGEENPEFGFTASGADAEGTPELTCVATANSPVGTYDIVVAKGTLTNYNTRFANGTLTITPATLKVSVGEYEREEGQDNPEFTITYEGWKNGEDERVLTVKPTATCESDKDAKDGTYVITVSGGEAENYVFEYTNGVLTVTVPSGISAILTNGQPVDIYTTTGVLVKKGATTLKGLSRGVYIVAGKKIVIK